MIEKSEKRIKTAVQNHVDIRYKTRKITLEQLIQLGVNVKTCTYCKKPMRLRSEYYDNIPSCVLFINKAKGIYVMIHRKCKKKYTAGLRK